MGVTSVWDNQILCLKGDISRRGHPSIVQWPADAFSRCVATNVSTTANMDAVWMADPAAESMNAAGDPNTEVLNRTPHSFWHVVIHQVMADGNVVGCTELILWARMASTLRTDPAAGDVIANLGPELVAPRLLERVHPPRPSGLGPSGQGSGSPEPTTGPATAMIWTSK